MEGKAQLLTWMGKIEQDKLYKRRGDDITRTAGLAYPRIATSRWTEGSSKNKVKEFARHVLCVRLFSNDSEGR